MDLVLLVCLIFFNGFLAMSEIAVFSSRRARLQRLADDGNPGAEAALTITNEPTGFLSTIQVGITTVGILSGAIGESALADPLTKVLFMGTPAQALAQARRWGVDVLVVDKVGRLQASAGWA